MKGNIIFLKGRNKAGNLVFYTKAGVQFARAIAEQVANPRTSAQVTQRARFKTIVKISKGLSRVLKTSLAPYDDARVSARNVFYRLNKALPMTITAGVVSNIDYTAVKIATGDLVACSWQPADLETTLHVKVQIDQANADGVYGLSTDDCNIVVFNPALNQVMSGSVKRIDNQKVDVVVPASWQGHEVKIYAFCSRGEGLPTLTSESEYLGSGEIA